MKLLMKLEPMMILKCNLTTVLSFLDKAKTKVNINHILLKTNMHLRIVIKKVKKSSNLVPPITLKSSKLNQKKVISISFTKRGSILSIIQMKVIRNRNITALNCINSRR
jgi:hypothetical protein